jgi:signal transduction histidine kinase/predicted RNA-binding protein with RPS1 domain
MDWAAITDRYEIGQIVQVCLTRIDHSGVYSVFDEDVKGYTKRAESQLTLRAVDLFTVFKIGQQVSAKIAGFNDKYQTVDLSFRQAMENPWPEQVKNLNIGDFIEGAVVLLTESKAIIEIVPGVAGILHKHEMWIQDDKVDDIFMVEDRVRLQIVGIDSENQMLILSARGLFSGEEECRDSQATYNIEEKLTDALRVYRWEMTRQKRRKYALSTQFRSRIKVVYIIDPSDTISVPLTAALDGFSIKTCRITIDHLDSLKEKNKSMMFLVACTQTDGHLSPLQLHEHFPDAPILICGTLEQIKEIQDKFCSIQAPVQFLKIPHAFEELISALNNCAAEENRATQCAAPTGQIPQTAAELSPIPEHSIDSLLKEMQQITSASSIFIFQVNLNSMDTDIFASIGKKVVLETFDRGHLQFSPISDVIVDGDYVSQEHGGAHFKYMKPLGPFESLIGIRIRFTDDCGYGLFFLGEAQHQFSHLNKQQIEFCEMAIRAYIEQIKYIKRTCEEQKFILAGKLTSNFMHEIKNQVQAMDYWLEVLKTDSVRLNNNVISGDDKAFKARFEMAIDGAIEAEKRALAIENLFLNLFRKEEKRMVRLDKYLEEFISTLKPIAGRQGVKLMVNCAKNIQVNVNVSSLNQILLNLFLNSMDFIPVVRSKTGLIEINACKKEDDLPVKIEFVDNGPGINERNKDKVFETLFTTKKNGSGLGLAISRFLVRDMGGRLSIKQTLRLSGTTLLMELPK